LPAAACVAPVPSVRRLAVPAAASDASASFDSAMAADADTPEFVIPPPSSIVQVFAGVSVLNAAVAACPDGIRLSLIWPPVPLRISKWYFDVSGV
jgi:hypothetical protein